jgi:hypothetical protein
MKPQGSAVKAAGEQRAGGKFAVRMASPEGCNHAEELALLPQWNGMKLTCPLCDRIQI